jgi:hypothetical protein
MKKYYSSLLIFLLLLFSVPLFAQDSNNSNNELDSAKSVRKELSRFYSYLKSYNSKVKFKAHMDTISIDTLRNIAKQMYEVREKDAVLAESTFVAECKLSDSLDIQKWKYKKNVQTFAKPSLTKHYLYQKIREALPHNIYPLIAADYLLRVNIKSVNNVLHAYKNYETGYTEPPLNYIEVKATIEDIIKGNSRFSVGQTIVFYYMPYWRKGGGFIAGDDCLVPLQARLSPEFHLNNIGLLTTLDSSYGKYPIINNALIDKDNYFEYGQKVSWNAFKNNLIELIKTIKTW